MKIGDMIVWYPAAIIAPVMKTIRIGLSEETKEYISNNNLYHITKNKETAEKIISSGFLKPSTGIFKNINSYGKSCACMFEGIPNMDNFIKNISINPYINPNVIVNAVEIDIKKNELTNSYKIRPFSDEAILYEGWCSLPKDRAKNVELVADLKRDEKGNPILNLLTKEPIGIELRKRTQKEIEESPNEYIPKKDYLDYMKEKSKQFGFLEGKNAIEDGYNWASNLIAGGKLELNEIKRSTGKNFIPFIKSFINIFKRQKMIDENKDNKIERLSSGKIYLNRKNPYADKKYSEAVLKFNKQGLSQVNLDEAICEFNKSEEGAFLRKKIQQIDDIAKNKKGIHGINHSNRVAMLSLMIAKGEGILEEDMNRKIEILTRGSILP